MDGSKTSSTDVSHSVMVVSAALCEEVGASSLVQTTPRADCLFVGQEMSLSQAGNGRRGARIGLTVAAEMPPHPLWRGRRAYMCQRNFQSMLDLLQS